MFDWNYNGKNDMGDSFIDYSICNSSNRTNKKIRKNKISDYWFSIIPIIILLILSPVGCIISILDRTVFSPTDIWYLWVITILEILFFVLKIIKFKK